MGAGRQGGIKPSRSRQQQEGGRGAGQLHAEEQRPGALHRAPLWLRRSALYRLLHVRLAAAEIDEAAEVDPADTRIQRSGSAGSRPGAEPQPFAEVRRNTVVEYFGVLGQLAREHRFEALVAAFPLLNFAKPNTEWSQLLRDLKHKLCRRSALIRQRQQYALGERSRLLFVGPLFAAFQRCLDFHVPRLAVQHLRDGQH